MVKYFNQLVDRLLSKDWGKITTSWIWIYTYVRKYWFQIGAYTVLGLVGTVFGLGSTVVSKNLIDAVTGFNTKSI